MSQSRSSARNTGAVRLDLPVDSIVHNYEPLDFFDSSSDFISIRCGGRAKYVSQQPGTATALTDRGITLCVALSVVADELELHERRAR